MIEVLEIISQAMEEMNINYAYEEWTEKPRYPYFVGDYDEVEPMSEDGQHEYVFTLVGFNRGSRLSLEEVKNQVEAFFTVEGKSYITESGSGVVISYASTSPRPTGNGEIKRIDIILKIKEWRV